MNIDVEQFNKPCSCGHEHSIVVKDIVIEKGAINRLPQVIAEHYSDKKNIMMVCDEHTYAAAGAKVEALLPGLKKIVLDPTGLHANEHGVARAEEAMKDIGEIDMLLAVGSGTVHDITRYHAFQRKIPFISVPTAASVDGFVSTVAAMTWNGCKVTIPAVAPERVIADTDIFAKAPMRLTASGVGDLLGKYTCLADWKISHVLTDEYICDELCQMEYDALDRVLPAIDGLVAGEEKAYEDLMYGLLLSGLAMQMIGNSRPASGAEHHMSHLWEMEVINDPVDYYHGEKVGVGLCIVSGIYHEAAKRMAGDFTVKDAVEVEEELIKKSIANPETYATLMKENVPNPLAGFDAAKLISKKQEVIDIINEIPTQEELIAILKKCQGVATLQDIGLDASYKEKTARLSPYVRARLTFMRILKFCDFYEEIIR